MLNVTTRDLDRLLRDLETFAKRSVPYAARDALNDTAFTTRRVWGDHMRRTFTLRNQYTAGRALLVDKARGLDVGRMRSVVGSIAPYMARQEEGGVVQGPVPGPVAAGQAAGGTRTKPVRFTNRLRAIAAAKANKGRSRQQRNAIALAIARRQNQKHVILERPKGGKGLFRLGGGKRKLTTRLVWSVDRGPSKLKAHPTLGPALRTIGPKLPAIYKRAIIKQMKRHGVFRS